MPFQNSSSLTLQILSFISDIPLWKAETRPQPGDGLWYADTRLYEYQVKTSLTCFSMWLSLPLSLCHCGVLIWKWIETGLRRRVMERSVTVYHMLVLQSGRHSCQRFWQRNKPDMQIKIVYRNYFLCLTCCTSIECESTYKWGTMTNKSEAMYQNCSSLNGHLRLAPKSESVLIRPRVKLLNVMMTVWYRKKLLVSIAIVLTHGNCVGAEFLYNTHCSEA